MGDGTVQCWGDNRTGALGDGTSTSRSTPRPVTQTCKDLFYQDKPCSLTPRPVPGLSGVVQISLGDGFACARKQDGSVTCWGNNGSGELGRGSISGEAHPPAPVMGLGAVSQLSAGTHSACARLTDGSLWCWGGNEGRQVGDGSGQFQPLPVQVD